MTTDKTLPDAKAAASEAPPPVTAPAASVAAPAARGTRAGALVLATLIVASLVLYFVGDRLTLRPPGRADAPAQIGDLLVRKTDTEGADFSFAGHQDQFLSRMNVGLTTSTAHDHGPGPCIAPVRVTGWHPGPDQGSPLARRTRLRRDRQVRRAIGGGPHVLVAQRSS